MSPISHALFQFLVELEANNNREWFQANKKRYEAEVRDPALGLIGELAAPLAALFPSFPVNASLRGGSLMRPYRDTRFAKDKTPYKTNVGIHIRHAAGADIHAPGLYLHLSPSECFIAAGIWMPPPEALLKIRTHIDSQQAGWRNVRAEIQAYPKIQFDGDALKRPPKGYDKDHPLIEDLRRKNFILVQNLSPQELLAEDASQQLVQAWGNMLPLMRFLCQALEVSL